MKRFAGIIFDMDGLLLDSERIALETFRQTYTYVPLSCCRSALGRHSRWKIRRTACSLLG